ncbi:DUF1285 domain-containing protein [Hellea sp.]|nr:DUF1285 domain-containing protein [Hellea sp.]
MENTLNGSKSQFSLQDLMKALEDTEDGQRPVEKWNPEYCGDMDMVIKADGSWWHEGSRITRRGLVGLFASILRKDEDGETYLVTPVEKIKIKVERAPFLAVRADIEGEGETQRIFFTTNLDEVVEAGPDNPIRVETDSETLEPAPYVTIRGRLEASLNRPVFYELVEQAVERQTKDGQQLGIWAGGVFFPLGPAGAHEI